VAAAVSAAGNGLLYAVASAAGAMPADVLVQTPGGEQPITLVPVLMASILPALIGAALLALLNSLTDRPVAWFVGISVVVVIGMAIPPLQIPEAPTAMIVTLEVMHLVAAGAIVGVLLRLGRAPQ
jgi:hypothetical protein